MEDITDKQNFLRKEIMNKGYNPQAFQEFMIQQSSTGDIDLDNWTMQDLRNVVEQFKQISVPQENAESVEENYRPKNSVDSALYYANPADVEELNQKLEKEKLLRQQVLEQTKQINLQVKEYENELD